MYYVEHFHWFSDSDQLSYILVTFKAAVEFLRGPEMEKWLPRNPPATRAQVTMNGRKWNSVFDVTVTHSRPHLLIPS